MFMCTQHVCGWCWLRLSLSMCMKRICRLSLPEKKRRCQTVRTDLCIKSGSLVKEAIMYFSNMCERVGVSDVFGFAMVANG